MDASTSPTTDERELRIIEAMRGGEWCAERDIADAADFSHGSIHWYLGRVRDRWAAMEHPPFILEHRGTRHKAWRLVAVPAKIPMRSA